MRQELNLTVDSECAYCDGTGMGTLDKPRYSQPLCACVEVSKAEESCPSCNRPLAVCDSELEGLMNPKRCLR